MPTKYILNGGSNIDSPEKNNNEFYSEILKDAPMSLKILLVMFANEKERWEPKTERVISEFNQNTTTQKLSFEVANEEDFIEQIQKSDVIYFAGGKTVKLLEALNRFLDLGKYLNGKIVAGESAGANIMAKYCYSPNADKVLEGLGILTIKLIVHYQEKYKGKLDAVGTELELVLLQEYKNKIFQA